MRVRSENNSGAPRRPDQIHEHFDGSGLTRAVLTDEGVERAFLHVEIDAVQSNDTAEALAELVSMDSLGHERLAASFAGVGLAFRF